MFNVGRKIKEEREKQGITQEEFAKKLGYAGRSAISKIEAKTSLPLKTIEKIADALGLPPSELMGWKDNSDTNTDLEGYYENNETADLAQKIKDNDQLKALFDIQSDMSPDELNAIYQMALVLKRKETNADE